jgi:uncharacterized protein YgbK (DUF1537 family)
LTITAVLDDDPTGTQAMADVPIVLDWSDGAVAGAVLPGDPSVHLLTNCRAHTAAEAGALTWSAAAAARAALPGVRLLLRGDSTLRGYVWEEYAAVRDVISPAAPGVPLLLVPAFPAAGRITIDGIHLLERDGERVPLHRTEYATDAHLSYSDARLARWAHERSGGRLPAADAAEVPLATVRADGGAEAIATAIRAVFRNGRPAVVVPDAETLADLEVIARGLRIAESDTPVIARCAPAFAAIVTGTAATGLVDPPAADRGVLVLCGSFVPTTTVQLAELDRARPGVTTFADVRALAADESAAEVDRLVAVARRLIDEQGLAVIATPRERDAGLADAAGQQRIARALARVAPRVAPGVLIAKGGITSAVTARDGLGARTARVIGPVVTGVSLWRLLSGPSYLVVPGNVGGPGLLAELVSTLLPRAGA